MDRLLAGIEERRVAVATGRPPTIEGKLPSELAEPVAAPVKRAVSESVAQRIWRRDPSLWGGPGVPEIENRLGWLTVADTMLEHAPELQRFAREVKAEGFTDCGAARHGRLLARPRGDPPLVRRAAGWTAPTGARLDPSRRGAGGPGVGRHREDAVHRLLEVRRHDRDAVALPPLQGAGRARTSSSS